MTITQTRTGTFVDTSVAVPNRDIAVAFWTTTMGFERVADAGADVFPWTIVRDPETDLRINLIEADFTPFALSFETASVRDSIEYLTAAGCTVQDQGLSDEVDAFEWALVRDPSGLPILLGNVWGDDSPHPTHGKTTTIPGRIGKAVDVVGGVDDVAVALKFWTKVMGFVEIERGENCSYVSLRNPDTAQVLCILGKETPGTWWFSVLTDDIDASVERFVTAGGTLNARGTMESTGFQWAACDDPSGIGVMLHTSHTH